MDGLWPGWPGFDIEPRMSSGSGDHLPSTTSTVIRHVKLCCCLLRLRVGNSLRTVTVGGGIGFFACMRGLTMLVSID